MKIIIANYRYFIAGGPERYMFKFMEEAGKRGVDCIPFSVDYSRNEESEYSSYFVTPRGGRDNLTYSNIKLTPRNIAGLIKSSIYNWEAEKKLRALIRKTHPDAVYILHEINSLSPSIIRAAKKEGVRVVHRISDFFMFCPKLDFLCGNEICESCMFGDYRKALNHKCVKGSYPATLVRVMAMKLYKSMHIFDDVDAFVSTCQFTRQKMIAGGISADKIHCVPTFIDATNIAPNYTNEGYFLYLGRVAEQKGVIYAVQAMVQLKDLPVTLRITGELDESAECQKIKKIIEDNNLQDKVQFVGFQHGEMLERTIANSMAVVNPAIWYENMPNTVIESYAYGKPVVATRVGSLAEIVEDERTGLLFNLKDSNDLARQLRRLALQPELVQKLGENARRCCEEKYNVDLHYDEIMRLLAEDREKQAEGFYVS